MKKIVSFFCLLFLFVSYMNANDPVAATVWGESGSKGGENAYAEGWYNNSATELTVSEPKQLGSFVKALKEGNNFQNQTVKLTADLDMKDFKWQSVDTQFKGIFDGNGHEITNLLKGDRSWAFIGAVAGGEIKKAVVNGDFIGSGEIGGIVGILSEGGKVNNSGYTGNIESTVANASIGGIVGKNEGGEISNCYFSGTATIFEGSIAGNIVGTSTGTVSNSYFKANETLTAGIGNGEGTNVEMKTAEEFASMEVPWLLNQYNQTNSEVWTSDGTMPVFASTANPAVFKLTYSVSEKGTVSGVEYAKAGSTIVLDSKPQLGYLFTGYSVTGVDELNITDDTFVMPNADLTISADYVDFEAPVVSEATNIKISGFTANWSAVEQADDYLLTVLDATGNPLKTYDAISVGNVTSYEVTNLLSDANYKYYIQAKKDKSVSKTSRQIDVATLAGASISYSPEIVDFKVNGTFASPQTIKVQAKYLTDKIKVALTGSEYFSVSTTELPMEGGDLVISYDPAVIGTHKAVLTLSTTGVEDVVINLNGMAELGTPKPVTLSVEKYSFIAKWDAIALAEKYLLSLSLNGAVVDGYNNVETTDCRYEFKGLNTNTTYTYVVSAVLGDQVIPCAASAVMTIGDYGKQLNNSGFEYWEKESDEAEPVDWNSFMTQETASDFGLGENARVKHMEQSNDVRPNSAGNSSVRIWTKKVVGVNANGNLTCGRIHAGSMTATSSLNNNYTVVGNPEFSESMDGAKPDSLTVWVKYIPKSVSDQARISAIIHDRYNYQDPTSGEENDSHVVAEAKLDYSAAGNNDWQRLTIPFDYVGPATSADYMLVTYTTNKTPGKGNTDDQVYIDDMLLIYKPSVKIDGTDKTAYQQGGAISVKYTLEGTMSPTNLDAAPNMVTLQLSDVEGTFADPVILTEVTTDNSGNLLANLPDDLAVGNYKIRIVTTNYPMTSESVDIKVVAAGESTITVSQPETMSATVNTSVEQTIVVEGYFLNNDINIALSDSEKGFSINKTNLPKEGGELIVTYSPLEVGNHTAAITLSSDEVSEPVLVNLNAVCMPLAPVILKTTNITPSGFTANWESVENVTDYKLTVFSGDVEVSSTSTGLVTSFDVTGLEAASDYSYKLQAIVNDISSLPVVSELVTTLRKPVLSVNGEEALDFGTVTLDESSDKQVIAVSGTDLLDDIAVAVTGTNFVVSPSTISKDADVKNITVVYKPTNVNKQHKATLMISTRYGEDVAIALTGASLPKPTVALPAQGITNNSFTANWEAVSSSVTPAYKVTVKKGDEILPNYDAVTVRRNTSLDVTDLEPDTEYTYSVVVVISSQESVASNEMSVTTQHAVGIDNASANKLLIYPSPAEDYIFVNGVEENSPYRIYGIAGEVLSYGSLKAGKADVSVLATGTYFVECAGVKAKFVKK